MKKYFCLIFYASLLFCDDYSFDMQEIEVKSYEYSGYIKTEHKYQELNEDSSVYASKNKSHMNSFFSEVELNFGYFWDSFKLDSKFNTRYENIDSVSDKTFTVDELLLEYTLNKNNSFTIGKKTLKWGKGYFFNPVAFIDRKKDPNEPEVAREGYLLSSYNFNKAYNSDLKNFGLSVVFLPTNENYNEDFYFKKSNNLALKAYFLYKDIDIDLIYLYSDKLNDKMGVDFSFNLFTNFELHAEAAKEINGYDSYLLGLKYLTANDLTLTSEYFYQSEQLNKKTSFWDNRYMINKFSQKEPFKIVYSSIYYKNSLNLSDDSHIDSLGFTYSFKNNVNVDISYNLLNGKSSSEFGSKLNKNHIWSRVTWFF